MNAQRPTITGTLLAAIIDAAPGRVRKRLDREPTAAANWQWIRVGDVWTITTGEENVQLKTDDRQLVVGIEMLSCSCLLSPQCFHLLAVVTSLGIADEVDGRVDAGVEADAEVGVEVVDDGSVDITTAMRQAAEQSLRSIDSLLVSGARASGLIVQSSLLRAAHQARAEGLVNLSAALIRVTEGIQRLRAADQHADSDNLRRDTILAIEAADHLLRTDSISAARLGYVRRPFSLNSLKRLTGVVAEPILTLSGYAGVVTHLIGDDGGCYQVVETRPGDASLISQAYRGGIDLGGTTASAHVISRSRIDVQNLTSSPDGRLGKGSRTRWAIQPSRDADFADVSQLPSRWSAPLRKQITRVFDQADSIEMPLHGRAGLVCVRGSIVGARGNGVSFQPDDCEATLTLGIAMDNAAVLYRPNLQMLARCPGLSIELFASVRLDQAGWIDALSFRPLSDDLTFPEGWLGRCHLGLDELKRHYFQNTNRFAVDIEDQSNNRHVSVGNDAPVRYAGVDLFPGLESRCAAAVIGGRGAVGSIGSTTHRRDHARLESRGQRTAADMLNLLATACAESPAATRRGSAQQAQETFRRPLTLAVIDRYCRESQRCYEREKWLLRLQ